LLSAPIASPASATTGFSGAVFSEAAVDLEPDGSQENQRLYQGSLADSAALLELLSADAGRAAVDAGGGCCTMGFATGAGFDSGMGAGRALRSVWLGAVVAGTVVTAGALGGSAVGAGAIVPVPAGVSYKLGGGNTAPGLSSAALMAAGKAMRSIGKASLS
jgi:hypothetical protein